MGNKEERDGQKQGRGKVELSVGKRKGVRLSVCQLWASPVTQLGVIDGLGWR